MVTSCDCSQKKSRRAERDAADSRSHRRREEVHETGSAGFRLIPWWDQKKLQSARVLVIGAGALGNAILKNLVLLGFERIVIVDLDKIEESNLSRSILYRSSDVWFVQGGGGSEKRFWRWHRM